MKGLHKITKALLALTIVSGAIVATSSQIGAESTEYISIARGNKYPFAQSTLSCFNLTGSAKLINDKVQLVSAEQSKTGGLFLNKKLQYTTGFSMAFSANFGNAGFSPADGLMIVIAKDSNSIGKSGGGMGYENIPNSIGIEYDTYNNKNAPIPHVTLNKNGIVDSDNKPELTQQMPWAASTNYNLYGWVDYNVADKKVDVYFSKTNDRATATKVSYQIELDKLIGNEYYLGFTSATGGAYQEVVINELYIDNKYHADGLKFSNSNKEDSTPPTLPTTIKNNNGQIIVSGSTDTESGVAKYQYSLDQKTWIDVDNISISNLPKSIYVRAIDKVGNIGESVLLEITEEVIPNPQPTPEPKKKNVKTSDNSNILLYSSLGGLAIILFINLKQKKHS